MKVDRVIKKSLKKRLPVRLITRPEGEAYDGIVLKDGRDYVAMACVPDLKFDGLVILPKKYIRGFREGKFEKTLNEIIRSNGEIKKMKGPAWLLKCGEMKDVLRQLFERKIWPIVHVVFDKEKHSEMYIGPIMGGDEKQKAFTIRHYSATAKWKYKQFIYFRQVQMVQWGDNYSKIFNKFMQSQRRTGQAPKRDRF